jgi:hypothetical protein
MVNPHPRDVERAGQHDKHSDRQAQATEPPGHSGAVTDPGAGMDENSGIDKGSPGGAVSGEIGIGSKVAGVGEADLGGDADLGSGAEHSAATHSAGGTGGGGAPGATKGERLEEPVGGGLEAPAETAPGEQEAG